MLPLEHRIHRWGWIIVVGMSIACLTPAQTVSTGPNANTAAATQNGKTEIGNPKDLPQKQSQPAGAAQEQKPGQSEGSVPAENQESTPRSLKSVPRDLFHDQIGIWTSPARIHKNQVPWLIPFLAGSAALFATDENTGRQVAKSQSFQTFGNDVSRSASGYVTFGFAGALALTGVARHDDKMCQTALLGAEAMIDAAIVGGGLKLAAERSRPSAANGEGRFWNGGSSFPSGHSITAWALATVVADQYQDHPWVRYSAFGWASLISVARIGSHQHFPSDALVGSVFGYLIGKYVMNHLDSEEGHHFVALPYFEAKTKSYGLNLSYGF
ncbi:MAG: phosphatase PAP2 family protein [Acidobacteriia bacterium]|nr:phosphatase PAP2 family protein [Terriglobia bacterium]